MVWQFLKKFQISYHTIQIFHSKESREMKTYSHKACFWIFMVAFSQSKTGKNPNISQLTIRKTYCSQLQKILGFYVYSILFCGVLPSGGKKEGVGNKTDYWHIVLGDNHPWSEALIGFLSEHLFKVDCTANILGRLRQYIPGSRETDCWCTL